MIHFFEKNDISLHLSDFEVLSDTFSEYNHSIRLLKHKLLGKVLIINDEIQHIEAWAPMYHESVVHIPISFIPKVKSALILGGGSFFAAHEILKYRSIERLIMVDYDNTVLTTIEKNYAHVIEIRKDNRFRLAVEDIASYIQKCDETFDFIINDAIDLLNCESTFLDLLTSKLSPNGVCSDLIYRHMYESERSMKTIEMLRNNYNSAFSLVVVPEYPGIMHLLSMWGKTELLKQDAVCLLNDIQKDWAKNIKKSPCIYYDPRFISYYLYIPPYVRRYVNNI